jgi:general secretion pathway protein L
VLADGILNAIAVAVDMISRFFAWWGGELKACLPDRVGAFFARRVAALVMVPADGGVAVAWRRNGRSRDLGRILPGPEPEQRRALAQLVRGVPVQDSDVIVNLPPESVPRRSVRLPLAAQENLREVLAFEMDRHTPFKASEVIFDYRVTGTDPHDQQLTVDLAVIPRALLERANGIASSLGLPLDGVGIAGQESPGQKPFNFLASEQAARAAAQPQRLLVMVAALLVAVMGAVAAYLPLYGKERLLAARQAELAEARAAALDADAMKVRLAARLERGRFLVDRRRSTPAATRLLAEVSERLPGDTWLLQLQWHGKDLFLSGLSPAATGLIEKLEVSPLLSEVHFDSPVTTDPRVKSERFDISAGVTATLDR